MYEELLGLSDVLVESPEFKDRNDILINNVKHDESYEYIDTNTIIRIYRNDVDQFACMFGYVTNKRLIMIVDIGENEGVSQTQIELCECNDVIISTIIPYRHDHIICHVYDVVFRVSMNRNHYISGSDIRYGEFVKSVNTKSAHNFHIGENYT